MHQRPYVLQSLKYYYRLILQITEKVYQPLLWHIPGHTFSASCSFSGSWLSCPSPPTSCLAKQTHFLVLAYIKRLGSCFYYDLAYLSSLLQNLTLTFLLLSLLSWTVDSPAFPVLGVETKSLTWPGAWLISHWPVKVEGEVHLFWDNVVCNLSCYFKHVKIQAQKTLGGSLFENLYSPHFRCFALLSICRKKKLMVNPNPGQPEVSIRMSRKILDNTWGGTSHPSLQWSQESMRRGTLCPSPSLGVCHVTVTWVLICIDNTRSLYFPVFWADIFSFFIPQWFLWKVQLVVGPGKLRRDLNY